MGSERALSESDPGSDHRATAGPAGRVDPGGIPRLRRWDARAGGHCRHDALLRGAAGDRHGARGDPRAPGLPGLHVHRSREPLRARRYRGGSRRVGDTDPDPHHARRRHHASDPRSHGLHHRRTGGAQPGPAPARGVSSGGRPPIAVTPDERRNRRRENGPRASRVGRSALRRLRARARGASDGGHRRRSGTRGRGSAGARVRRTFRDGAGGAGRRPAFPHRDHRMRLAADEDAAARRSDAVERCDLAGRS